MAAVLPRASSTTQRIFDTAIGDLGDKLQTCGLAFQLAWDSSPADPAAAYEALKRGGERCDEASRSAEKLPLEPGMTPATEEQLKAATADTCASFAIARFLAMTDMADAIDDRMKPSKVAEAREHIESAPADLSECAASIQAFADRGGYRPTDWMTRALGRSAPADRPIQPIDPERAAPATEPATTSEPTDAADAAAQAERAAVAASRAADERQSATGVPETENGESSPP